MLCNDVPEDVHARSVPVFGLFPLKNGLNSSDLHVDAMSDDRFRERNSLNNGESVCFRKLRFGLEE